MVRAIGSYPIGHKFESHRRYHANKNDFVFYINIRPVGQAVKTPPFHGGNMGSSPVRVTSKKSTGIGPVLFCCVLPSGEPIGFARAVVNGRYPYGSPTPLLPYNTSVRRSAIDYFLRFDLLFASMFLAQSLRIAPVVLYSQIVSLISANKTPVSSSTL